MERVDLAFEEMKATVIKADIKFDDKICLEIGPGNSYISAYNFLLNGARKVILVDKYPRIKSNKRQQKQLIKESSFIKSKYGQESLFFIKNGRIDERYIEFVPKDLTEAVIANEIDFVYSNSVLEHIKDVEKNIKIMSQIIKQGGLLYHAIDLRDHFNFHNPFLFLKYSHKTWEKYLTKEGVSYTNRLRYSEYKRLFNIYGLETVDERIKRYSMDNILINDKFNFNDENINVGILKILLIKR